MASQYIQQGKIAAGKHQLTREKAVDISPMEVFFSYSHADEKLRKELEKHLGLLKQQRDITTWYDRDIGVGAEWEQEISEHLNTARIILLLISPDFMSSDYCYSKEMKRAVERHESGEACVIPIILRPCDWQKAPFGKLQALPKDAKPVTSWSSQDAAFLDVVKGIREAIERLRLSPVSTQPLSKTHWIVPPYYPRNPSFTDRQSILSDLHNTFTTGKASTLIQQAVRGLGGMGKTQCALEYAYRNRDYYQAVFWTNATSQETLVADFVNIAIELHLSGKDAQDQTFAVTAVKHWLETNTGWLLILDNADDLDLIYPFLPSEGEIEGEGHILLTTSTQVTPLTMKSVKIKEMDQVDGVLFLLRRAQIIKSDASLDAASTEDRAIASKIVRELGGLPLALDEAGAYMYETKCSLSRYLQLYQTQHAALLKRRGTSLPYPVETVAATWHLAFEKVQQANPAAADMLRLCAFLSPDAIPEEIISVGALDLGPVLLPIATDPLKLDESIEKLLKFSLVDRDGETLTIQRLVQTVLQDEMDEDTRRLWAGRAVRAVNRAFPKVDVTTWSSYVSQAQKCAELIKDYKLLFLEAGRLLYEAGHYLFDRAQYAQAEPLYQQALEIRKQVPGTEYPDAARILHDLAKLYHTKNDYIKAESLYRQALEIRKQVPGTEYLDTASILHDLTWLYKAQGQYEQAEWLFKEAEEICEQVLGAKDPDTASTLRELAWLYRDLNTYERAEALYRQALEISKQVLGAEHSDTARILHDLAWFYQDRGQYPEAEQHFKEALKIRERVLGLHDQTADSLHALAWFYRKQEKYELAESFYRRALKIRRQVLELAPATANTLFDFAWFCKDRGQYPEAERHFKEALKIRRQVLGTENPDTAWILHDLAWLYQDRGQYPEAEQHFKEALKIRERVLGPGVETANTLYALAWLYQLQGRNEQSEPLFQEAREMREQVLGPPHSETADT
jgi:tetratricopeptide (TPR) repeat protein